MLDSFLRSEPHRRYDPLQGEWVVVSPHRTQRPWQGQVEKPTPDDRPTYDPACYLCPGNHRAGGARNPDYTSTYVFTNDFPSLLPDVSSVSFDEGGLLHAQTERGTSRVVCFSPRHDLTLAQMDPAAVRAVVDTWADQYDELAAWPFVHHVQIFENRGAMMGASNPHPHGQLWATEHIAETPRRELGHLAEYRERRGRALLSDYLALEEKDGERVVCANDHFVVVVPFWAVWPFETLLISRAPVGTISELDDAGRDALADIIRRLTIRYDNVFSTSFPYSMGFHQRPPRGDVGGAAHLHAHYYPPLLRSATVRKFMVGYEMLGEPQRDITPEAAAERLREVGELHYSQRTATEAQA
ncbi:MAG: UDP-glucose--hexose-1-phosphate uridylyltransferase [Anaerolineae bacterium]|nr:UDP-glucose--hexose-1-phosphate uridylyltransferase [Anaerolineae bacterium]